MSRWFDGSSSSIRFGSASSSLASISRFCSPPLSDSTGCVKALGPEAAGRPAPARSCDRGCRRRGGAVRAAGGRSGRPAACARPRPSVSAMASATDCASCSRAISPARALLGLVPERAARLPLRLLLEIAEMDRRVETDRAAVGVVLAGQDAQQRRLAAAVGADQPDPLARADLERHPVQHRLGAEVLFDTVNFEKDHPRTRARWGRSSEWAAAISGDGHPCHVPHRRLPRLRRLAAACPCLSPSDPSSPDRGSRRFPAFVSGSPRGRP